MIAYSSTTHTTHTRQQRTQRTMDHHITWTTISKASSSEKPKMSNTSPCSFFTTASKYFSGRMPPMYRLPPSVFACRLMGALAADPMPSRILIHRTSLVGSLPGTIGAASTAACGCLPSVGGITTSSYVIITVLVRTVYRTISTSACRTSKAGSRRWTGAGGETEIWRPR